MAYIQNFIDGTLTLQDGTSGTPLEIDIPYCNGDFSASGLEAVLREIAAYQSRGELVGLRHTNRKFISGSFSAMVDGFSHATQKKIADMIMGTGSFAARVSTTTAIGDVQCFNMIYTATQGAETHTITLTDLHVMFDFAEGDPTAFTINYTCYGTVTLASA